jgi:hypothetical protein
MRCDDMSGVEGRPDAISNRSKRRFDAVRTSRITPALTVRLAAIGRLTRRRT